MNFLVIATHHGAFLTIQQLKQLKIKNVTVVIPQSQIDKYKTFDGEIFKKYEQNMKKFCGRKIKLYVSSDWNFSEKIKSAYNFINTISGTGEWVVLEAGSLLGNKHDKFPKISTFGVVKSRVHPKLKKLYKMLGEPETSDVVSVSSFFINMDDKAYRITYVDSDYLYRPDILYSKSFGSLWCIRHRQAINDAFTVNFWMESIRGKQEAGEWVAYPYDMYQKYAEKVKDYLPTQTYTNIVSNGLKSAWLQDVVALDL